MKAKPSLLVVTLSVFAISGLTCPEDCVETDPNLAVDRIDFTLVSQSSPTRGTVWIEGVIQNKGGSTFDSSPGQQAVQLYEGTNIEPVAQQRRLAVPPPGIPSAHLLEAPQERPSGPRRLRSYHGKRKQFQGAG